MTPKEAFNEATGFTRHLVSDSTLFGQAMAWVVIWPAIFLVTFLLIKNTKEQHGET